MHGLQLGMGVWSFVHLDLVVFVLKSFVNIFLFE